MRLAIDASIWSFQTQAGQGGSNPALRTLYYRLVRLLSLSIKPLFVFDGTNKPPFKRNVKTGSHGAHLPSFVTKQLLDLFGFPYHTAPGEAEAECALLQSEGIVDAVLSEDVDTMMFGCTVHLRNWSSENTRGNKSPTHVNLYKAEATKQGKSGLDSHGMILVALMSGGDYIPAGVPGCGVKIACEAARAGFGRDLCRLSSKDTIGFNQWRERLQYELCVNESGFFRTRHKALEIPEKFPDRKVLSYYTHPVVSKAERISHIRDHTDWNRSIDVLGLRNFVTEAFEWQRISGARKFLRTLAPAMLVDQLCRRYNRIYPHDDLSAQEIEEAKLISTVCGRRNHWVTDGVSELRIVYTPTEIVGLDLTSEEPDIEVFPLSESEDEAQADQSRERSRSPPKRNTSTYNPSQPDKIWVLESYVKFGIPLMVENWEESMRDPKKFASRKARERAAVKKRSGKSEFMKPGAMDAFVRTMKPGIDRSKLVIRPKLPPKSLSTTVVDLGYLTTEAAGQKAMEQKQPVGRPNPATPKKAVSRRRLASGSGRSSISKEVNPWTLAKRPPDTLNVKLPPGTRFSALGICEPSSLVASPGSVTQESGRTPQGAPPHSPTPIFNSSCRRQSIPDPGEAENAGVSSNKRVNRKLDFAVKPSPILRSRSSTPDLLPSPPAPLSPPLDSSSINSSTGRQPPGSPRTGVDKNVKHARALLALRESLNGTWRDIEPWERTKPYIKAKYEQVEIIDLTRT